MKRHTLSELRNLTALGFALIFCIGSVSMNIGYTTASSGALESGALSVASAVGVIDTQRSVAISTPLDTCVDLIDSDDDGAVDCSDPDCYGNPYCAGYESSCSNGVDDDFDGLVDCSDIECAASLSCKNI